MKKTKSAGHEHRTPAAVISCAVCWYFCFTLSLRDFEELLLERGVVVTRETVPVRRWGDKFSACSVHRVKATHRKPSGTGSSTKFCGGCAASLIGDSEPSTTVGAGLDVLLQKSAGQCPG